MKIVSRRDEGRAFAGLVRGAACWTILAAMAVGGCKRPGTASTVPAAGTLKAGGAAVAGVNITLTPAQGRSATATTDAEGRFRLSTFVRDDGAVPGRHRVTLSMNDAGEPMPGTPEAAAWKPSPRPFAKRYGALTTTDLEVELPASGNTAIALDIDAK